MAVKGIHSRSYSNFCRNLLLQYSGTLEFIFVVESEMDPVIEVIQKAAYDTKVNIKVAVAGLSFHNAQKVHNMVYGVTQTDPQSEYVLFIDDDVYLYSGLVDELIDPILSDPETVFLSTGNEFVVPAKDSSIASYVLFFYRLHNMLSFITNSAVLVWGGCWFGSIRLFKENFNSLIDCYLDGGYSDDTIISTIVQQHKKVCYCPFKASFPNQPAPDISFRKVIDFITRQFFVLDTYSNNYNKWVGHSLVLSFALQCG